MTAVAYSNPSTYLGIKTGDIYGYDFAQQVAIIEPEVLGSFEVDVIAVGRGLSLDDEDWRDRAMTAGSSPRAHIPFDLRSQHVPVG